MFKRSGVYGHHLRLHSNVFAVFLVIYLKGLRHDSSPTLFLPVYHCSGSKAGERAGPQGLTYFTSGDSGFSLLSLSSSLHA